MINELLLCFAAAVGDCFLQATLQIPQSDVISPRIQSLEVVVVMEQFALVMLLMLLVTDDVRQSVWKYF